MNRSCAIGIDVGGSKTAAGLVDAATGRLVHAIERPTGADAGGAPVLALVRDLQRACQVEAARLSLTVEATGVGICEIVSAGGRLLSHGLIDWRGQDHRDLHLVSDVRAAALAEARHGAARGCEAALFVSIGTGISAVLLVDGQPYMGSTGAAVALASAPVDLPAPDGRGMVRRAVEHVASGPGLADTFRQLGGVGPADPRAILKAAGEGEALALRAVRHAAGIAGSLVASMANQLDPSLIVIGGGLGSAPGAYWDCLGQAIAEGLWTGSGAHRDIRQAMLGSAAGVVGAALAAREGRH